jgi:prepilin signal peptidase PulO-like enzyme (type II secretory pathway)
MPIFSALASPTFFPFAIGLSGFLGACVGSFLSLVTYRLPRGEKIGATRSQCPHCSTVLRAPDLVPVLSWLAMRGRCRTCARPISIRYPLTELACAVGTALLVRHFGVTLEALALCGLWWSIVAIFLTDLEHYIILDEVQVAVGLFGILYGWTVGLHPLSAALAALAGLLIGLALKYGFIYLRHKDGLGMGDVKFLFVAGIWLADAADFVPFLFFSGLLGIVSGILWKLLGLGERFPFGPALAGALFLCVLFPQAADGFWQLYGIIHE